MRSRTKVFVVDDHSLFRSGIRSELADRVWVCGEAGTVEAAVAAITEQGPAVVLLDVHLPPPGAEATSAPTSRGGVAVIEGVRDAGVDDVAFLALSASDTPADVIDVIRAGARGYVTKTVSADELVDAIVRVADGDAVFSPRLAGYVLDAFASLPVAQIDEDLAALTRREREVLQLVARGYTYRELGERLVISVKTVESHVSSVLRKLQLANRHELSRWAAERHIT